MSSLHSTPPSMLHSANPAGQDDTGFAPSTAGNIRYDEPDLAHASRRPGYVVALDVLAPILRLVLAALFIFGGLVKLGWVPDDIASSPREFATAIRKYRLFDYQLVPWAAFAVPWVELVGGAALLIGFLTRGAATLLILLLGMLTGGILLVMFRGIEIADCSCFGGQMVKIFGDEVGGFLESSVGWMSVIRNLTFIVLALFLASWGSGYLGLDRLFKRPQ